jgi:hypothetical protein
LSLPLARAADFSVTYAGGSAYAINGTGGNPTLTLVRGRTYTFALNTTSSHPFRINSAGAPSSGMFTGTISYTVPTNVANYTYRCTIHGFGGDILTVAPPPPPVVRIVDVSVGTNIVLRSTGTNTWTVFPEYRTNVTQTNWFALTVQTNRFANGTNETFCGKPPGDSVFIRIRAQEN